MFLHIFASQGHNSIVFNFIKQMFQRFDIALNYNYFFTIMADFLYGIFSYCSLFVHGECSLNRLKCVNIFLDFCPIKMGVDVIPNFIYLCGHVCFSITWVQSANSIMKGPLLALILNQWKKIVLSFVKCLERITCL